MRKRALQFIVILFFIHSLSAVNYSLAPFNGSFGVNLGSEIYNEEIDTSLPNTGWVDIGEPLYKGDGKYNNNCIVAMGEINSFDSKDYYIRVTVNTDSDFNYVSMSNPSYKRPYTLTIIGKCSNIAGGGNPKLLGKYELRSNGSNFAEFKFSEGEIELNPDNAVNNALWFDIILGLPVSDITSSGLLTLPSGEQITLGRVDDYASFVTITMEYGKEGEAPQIATMSIPFSGYYRADNSNNDPNATVSLHVDTNAKISALDIKNDAKTEINIARLRFSQTAIFSGADYASHTINDTKLNTVRMFVSASPDPFVQEPDGFRLLHADYKYNEPVNDYNSVPFSILVRPSNSSDVVEFDGLGYVTGSEIIGNSLTPEVHDSNVDFPRSAAKAFYVIFEGDMSIYIDYDGYPMKPGLYQEEVYVHVIAEE